MSDTTQQFKKAKKYALLILRFRPRSTSEFRGKLAKHGFDEGVISELTDDFTKRGLLDDAKFAKLWVQDRRNLKPMGKIKLKEELEVKGIDEYEIDSAINDASGEFDEESVMMGLAQKRLKLLKGLDKDTAKRRLSGYLQRRGFSFELITKVLKELVK